MPLPRGPRALFALFLLIVLGWGAQSAMVASQPDLIVTEVMRAVVEPKNPSTTASLMTTTTSTTTTSTTTTTITTTTTLPPTTTTTLPPTTTIAPLGPNETLIATANDTTNFLLAYDGPDGNIMPLPFPVPNPHQFGGPLTLRVTDGSIGDEWVKVELPVRPNGQEGWIPTSDYELSTTTIHAEVNLSNTSVQVFDDGVLIAETQAAIGAPSTPTPLGTFFVTAVRVNPPSESFLGTHTLALSAFSEAHETFAGGLPVIAIHGTNSPQGQLGRQISNGCIRIPNDVVTFLAENVPQGTPVTISG